jgi:hypothetical protein
MAIDFNGSNQYASFSTSAQPTDNFTYCGWFESDNISPSTEQIVYGQYNPPNKEGVSILISSSYLYMQGGDGTSWVHLNMRSTTTLSSNTTYHFLYTRAGTAGKLYFNGALHSNYTTGANAIDYGSNTLHLARASFVNAAHFNGEIWDCRIYGAVLSAEEVKAIYEERGADGITRSLLWRSPCDEGKSGDTVSAIQDVSISGMHASNIYNSPTYTARDIRIG